MTAPPHGGGPSWADGETRVDVEQGQLSLIAEGGPLHGRIYGSTGAPVTIGRDATCAIPLPIAESSRRHARIEYRGGRFWVEDLGSLNGTRVNDRLIEGATALDEHDLLNVSGQPFRVRLGVVDGRAIVEDGADSTSAKSLPSLPPESTKLADTGAKTLIRDTVVEPKSRRGAVFLVAFALFAAALAGGVFAGRHRARQRVAAVPTPSVVNPPRAVPPPPPKVTPAPTFAPARFEIVEPTTIPADADLTIVKSIAAGAIVQRGDVLVQYRKAGENGAGRVAGNVRAPKNGVVSGDVPAVGAHVRAGEALLQLGAGYRLVTSATAVEGDAQHCKISFADRPALSLTVDRGAPTSTERAFVVAQIPDGMTLGDVGRVHVTCTD